MRFRTISAVTKPFDYREQNFQREINNALTASKTFRLWAQHYSVYMHRNKSDIYRTCPMTYTGVSKYSEVKKETIEQNRETRSRYTIDCTFSPDQRSMRTVTERNKTLQTSSYIRTLQAFVREYISYTLYVYICVGRLIIRPEHFMGRHRYLTAN
jgi:hypothetical protein